MSQNEEKNKKQRDRRLNNSNMYTKRYEKTKKGYLMRTYRNMLSRVSGVLHKKAHLYKGLPILDKYTFYAYSLEDMEFNTLFDTWTEEGYPQKLSPSIDRIDPDLGYVLGNIQWLTHSDNSRKVRR